MSDMFRVQGAASLMKDGGRIYGGSDAKLKNIDAARQLTDVLKTSMGPKSALKMIVNHIDKVFVTSDASTIVEQMEIQHPAVKTIINAAQSQAEEFGDQTSFLMCFAGELLSQAGELIQKGVHCVDIIKGFELCLTQIEKHIDEMTAWEPTNDELMDADTLKKIAYTAISSKAPDYAEFFSQQVGKAAQMVINGRKPSAFKAANVRTVKIPGGSVAGSSVIHGLVIPRGLTSAKKLAENTEDEPLKCVVLNCDLAHASTDTTGNVLITDADKMSNFNQEEDALLRDWVKGIKDKGVKMILVGGHISDVAQHFVDEQELISLRVSSKFELKRLCQAVRAPTMSKLVQPQEDDMGIASKINEIEIGSTKCVVIEAIDSAVSTVVLRGSSQAALDEVERAIDDGLGVIEAAVKDARFTCGGGASDMQLSLLIEEFAGRQKGLEQYSAKAFAEALKLIPSVLIENAGLPRTATLTALAKAHKNGNNYAGVNMDSQGVATMYEEGRNFTLNHLLHSQSKKWAIKFAVDCTNTILNVDQIIMSKPAGGPKFPKQGHWDAQDDKMPY